MNASHDDVPAKTINNRTVAAPVTLVGDRASKCTIVVLLMQPIPILLLMLLVVVVVVVVRLLTTWQPFQPDAITSCNAREELASVEWTTAFLLSCLLGLLCWLPTEDADPVSMFLLLVVQKVQDERG
jgi:hypothetical protein